MFLTNNSSKSVDKYIEKMRNLGIETVEDDFLTSTNATCIYLEKEYKDKKIYAFGTKAFKEQLKKSGYNAGIDTVFVLSGEGTMKNVEESDFKPTFIRKNIKEVYDEMVKQ